MNWSSGHNAGIHGQIKANAAFIMDTKQCMSAVKHYIYIYSITNYNVCREQRGKDGEERERERGGEGEEGGGREREGEKKREKREREEGRLCVCTCMCVHTCTQLCEREEKRDVIENSINRFWMVQFTLMRFNH